MLLPCTDTINTTCEATKIETNDHYLYKLSIVHQDLRKSVQSWTQRIHSMLRGPWTVVHGSATNMEFLILIFHQRLSRRFVIIHNVVVRRVIAVNRWEILLAINARSVLTIHIYLIAFLPLLHYMLCCKFMYVA